MTRSFGPIRAVRDVDLTIGPGEVVALLGPNGAGRSTTIDMLLGLRPPDRGQVRLAGRTPAEAIAAGSVGAMLQTGGLIRDLSAQKARPEQHPPTHRSDQLHPDHRWPAKPQPTVGGHPVGAARGGVQRGVGRVEGSVPTPSLPTKG